MTAKQEAFCQAVVAGNNQSAAYRLAYDAQKMKGNTVHRRAFELMANGKVTARIKILRAENAKLVQHSRERWLAEIQRCAFFDPRKLFDVNGNALPISELADEDVTAIAGFEVTEEFEGRGENREKIGYTKKFKLTDKLRALELLGKATGYYVEKKIIEKDNPLQDAATDLLLVMRAELQRRVAEDEVMLPPPIPTS